MSSPPVKVKICGIKDERGMEAALEAGADYIGFIFAEGSPRQVTPQTADKLAKAYAEQLRPRGCKLVAVMVDPSDQDLADVLTTFSPDILQLHGKETPERVREIAGVYDLQLVKALPIAEAKDLKHAEKYVGYADKLLFDTKSPSGQHGGTGESFDWNLLRGQEFSLPWFLSGGLSPDNVLEAISVTGAARVDVSSGVESERGVKDAGKMKAFVKAVRSLEPEEDEEEFDED